MAAPTPAAEPTFLFKELSQREARCVLNPQHHRPEGVAPCRQQAALSKETHSLLLFLGSGVSRAHRGCSSGKVACQDAGFLARPTDWEEATVAWAASLLKGPLSVQEKSAVFPE